MFINIIKHDLLIHLKSPIAIIQSIIFFIVTISIFGITTNIDNSNNSIAIIWVILSFAILLSSNNFRKDFEDGNFEQLILSGYLFEIIILAKIIAEWLSNSIPLILILPIITIFLKLETNLVYNLILVALIASLIINFLVSFGSALTLSSSQTSSLLAILILPLLIPIIIFANSAFSNDFTVSIKFLSALLIFLIPILTFGTAMAVKANVID